MSDEIIKWLVSTGVGGVIGGVAMWQLHHFRKDMANLPEWLAAIHSRLGSLGADSVPPPIPPEITERHVRKKMQRIRTAPVGFPIRPQDKE